MKNRFIVELLQVAEQIGKNIATVKEAARKAGIPVVYVNDNFGKWKSDFHTVIEHVIKENKPGKKSSYLLLIYMFSCLGKPVAKLLLPTDDDCMFKKRLFNSYE